MTRPTGLIPLSAALFALLLVLVSCGREDGETNGDATLSAISPADHGQPPLPESLRSPAGRVVEPGMIDEMGYVLPLDVLALKKKRGREEMPRPVPREREDADRSPFEEHMLNVDDGHTQNETSIAVAGNTVIAGWNKFTASGLVMGVSRSIDGGHNWSTGFLGGHPDMSDPVVKAGQGGRWYYAYLASVGAGGNDIDIYVHRSDDDGLTWLPAVPASVNSSFDDKPYIDAAGDEVLVGWADFGYSPSKLTASRSLDGGITFGGQQILSVNSVAGNGACPVIGPEGNYYMFWRDSWQDSLWVSRSLDQGATWSDDRGIVPMSPLNSSAPGGYRIVNLPTADADPVTGDLLVLWNDRAFGDGDVLAVRSSDAGLSWSDPVQVNDDVSGEDQFFPWVTFDVNGVAHAVWYDRREDGYNIDVYYSRSPDGGESWEPNVRLTDSAFTPVLPWEGSAASFIGDYNGIAASATTVYPFYQDSRNGEQDVYVSLVPNDLTAAPEGGLPIAAVLVADPATFTDRTRISLAGERAAAQVKVHVFGVSGRRLRTLALGADGAVFWDGRDDGGRDLPAGVYFARLAGSKERGTRIVRLR